MTETASIRAARASEIDSLARLIAESFYHLPLTRWLVPEQDTRTAALAGQFVLFVEHALSHGDVYVAEDGLAVAVWFPSGPIPDVTDYDARLAAACGPYTSRFAELDAAMHHAHPAEPDHAYLSFLSVDESVRNRGIGSALLDVHHRRLDADGTPAYLDASGVRSRGLYLRHGYTDFAAPYGAGDVKGLYPMWREPK